MYIREAHPADSHWEDPSLEVDDPTSDGERVDVANRCAAALELDVPMVVDGVDDAVNMAYSAWPERIYVLRPDGTIHYKGGLGPGGFRPQEAAGALAGLLDESPPELDGPEVAPDCVDDGFSGLWTGSGRGRIMPGDIPIRLTLALGADGAVGGKAEVTSARYPLPLLAARYDADAGTLTAEVPMQGRRMELSGTVAGQSVTARIVAPNGSELMLFTAKRVRKGPPLEPGPADPAGAWTGVATARDPALQGKTVHLVLTEVEAQRVAGAVVVGDVKATIVEGRYDARTGAFACRARTEDGTTMVVDATITAARAVGSVMMQPALVVAFELTPAERTTEAPGAGGQTAPR